ncbi:MAG: hypothetical protein ACOYB2_07615 [Limnohabitans sp.]|jgi:hypothetical protein
MFPNAKGSELLAILATIDPINQTAGSVTTGWISVANYHALMTVFQSGGLGISATVDAKLQQATDSSGTGVKDISGKAITQLLQTASGANRQILINLKPDELDVNNGYCYVRLSVTVAVAACQIAAQVLGLNPRFASADTQNQAAVVQIL